MGRYLDGKCRLCRREGMKLFLKGTRCNTEKCSFTKRPVAPGPKGAHTSSKASYYSLQLREKQKTKRSYGMLERQFRRFFQQANKSKGATGKMLLQLLERRLDNVIYRSLFVLSRNHARQLVCHGGVFIKNRRVDIPSYIVAEGDEIEIRVKDITKKQFKDNFEINSKERSIPSWLDVDKDNLKIKIAHIPEREELGLAVNEQLIVELYSK